jgi:hypothetical protein
MSAQQSERDYKLKVKFASLDDEGHLRFDAVEEYQGFFQDLPNGWRVMSEETVTTRFERYRRAWNLKHEHTDLVAVEHESGIEVIWVGIAVGTAGTVAAEAIVGLVKWAWHKWNSRRESLQKPTSFLIVEELIDKSTDGSIRSYRRTEVR